MLRHKSERESHRVKQSSSVQLSLQPSFFFIQKTWHQFVREILYLKKKNMFGIKRWLRFLTHRSTIHLSAEDQKSFFVLFCFFLCYACPKRPVDGEKSNTVQEFMGFKGAILNPARLLRSGQQMTMSPLSIVTDQFVVFHLKFNIWSACREAVGPVLHISHWPTLHTKAAWQTDFLF